METPLDLTVDDEDQWSGMASPRVSVVGISKSCSNNEPHCHSFRPSPNQNLLGCEEISTTK